MHPQTTKTANAYDNLDTDSLDRDGFNAAMSAFRVEDHF
jgi:hypothetical protein